MNDFGFLGTGNMASAICRGLVKNVFADCICLSDRDEAKANALANELSANKSTNAEVASKCRFIFLGVKPQALEILADEITPYLDARKDRFVIVSMSAGRCIWDIERLFGDYPIIRIMPNLPAAVGEGMILCAKNDEVTDNEYREFAAAMSGTGTLDEIPEGLIDAASAVSGCGPAYVFEIIEALADGAVACGVPRDKAYLYAAQTLLGSASLMLKTGKAPAELKDAVCSPGGTTIQGVRKLEEGGLRSALMEAVIAAYEKTLNI